jgi:hypothetical protein
MPLAVSIETSRPPVTATADRPSPVRTAIDAVRRAGECATRSAARASEPHLPVIEIEKDSAVPAERQIRTWIAEAHIASGGHLVTAKVRGGIVDDPASAVVDDSRDGSSPHRETSQRFRRPKPQALRGVDPQHRPIRRNRFRRPSGNDRNVERGVALEVEAAVACRPRRDRGVNRRFPMHDEPPVAAQAGITRQVLRGGSANGYDGTPARWPIDAAAAAVAHVRVRVREYRPIAADLRIAVGFILEDIRRRCREPFQPTLGHAVNGRPTGHSRTVRRFRLQAQRGDEVDLRAVVRNCQGAELSL